MFATCIKNASIWLGNIHIFFFFFLPSVSCTIWEGNECKKADLTALDISSAIIQKVDSTHHSTEYLCIGVFFAVALSFLPLIFRLKNGASAYDIQDVTTDVFTLTVPSSEEVVRITDGLIELMWGKGLRWFGLIYSFLQLWYYSSEIEPWYII